MNKKYKCFVLFYSLRNVGGAEKNFLKLAEEIDSNNLEIKMMLGGELNEIYKITSIPTYSMSEEPNLRKPLSMLRFILRVREILTKSPFHDFEFISFGPIYSFIAVVTKLTFSARYKIRVTVSERNSISLKKESWLVKIARWIYFRQADLITTNSKKNYYLISNKGHQGCKLVRNYFEYGPLAAKQQCIGVMKLVIVSRLEPQKRVSEILQKLSEASIHTAIKVDVFGAGSEYERVKVVSQKINNIENRNINIELNGFVPHDLIPLSEYDFSLHFSDYEGASNSMIESLLNGIPLLCSEHHVEEVDFLVPDENCFVCDIDQITSKLSEISRWQSKVSREKVRQVTLMKLELHPLMHEVILQDI